MKDCGIASIIAVYYQICCCVIPSLVTAIYSKLYRKSDRLLGGGDEAYYTYVEEADDDANKGSA